MDVVWSARLPEAQRRDDRRRLRPHRGEELLGQPAMARLCGGAPIEAVDIVTAAVLDAHLQGARPRGLIEGS